MATSGACKWFSAPKGYGFVTGDEGTDVFVHYSDLQMDGFRKLLPDQRVTYTVITDANGKPRASAVVPSAPPDHPPVPDARERRAAISLRSRQYMCLYL